MTPGLVAFFVVLFILSAAYAILSPINEAINPSGAGPRRANAKKGLFDQLVRPIVGNLLPQAPRSFLEYARGDDKIAAMLAKTGNPWRVNPEEYVIVRAVAVIGGVLLMMTISVVGYPVDMLIAIPIGAFLGWIGPKALLDAAWGKRRRDLNTVLPEALDLLRICMDAGLNFQNGMQQTVSLLQESETRVELSRVVAELRAGRTLAQALDGLARRCPTDTVDAFTRAISQAQATGADIAATLAYQAEEARSEYERMIETRSQKLQTTLFLPMIGFFLPTLLVLLLGPSTSSMMGVLG
jgi:tight adherence protein C